MVYRIALANADKYRLARLFSGAGFAGTITDALGFGAWGIEPSHVLECAVPTSREASKLMDTVAEYLREAGEQAAYVTVDGADAFLLWSTNAVERIAA